MIKAIVQILTVIFLFVSNYYLHYNSILTHPLDSTETLSFNITNETSKNVVKNDLRTPITDQLLFIGIFTTAKRYHRRSLLRALYKPFQISGLQYKFIVGSESDPALTEQIEAEKLHYQDIISLDIKENMDDGKTYHYFRQMSKLKNVGPFKFVIKSDDDTMAGF